MRHLTRMAASTVCRQPPRLCAAAAVTQNFIFLVNIMYYLIILFLINNRTSFDLLFTLLVFTALDAPGFQIIVQSIHLPF